METGEADIETQVMAGSEDGAPLAAWPGGPELAFSVLRINNFLNLETGI